MKKLSLAVLLATTLPTFATHATRAEVVTTTPATTNVEIIIENDLALSSSRKQPNLLTNRRIGSIITAALAAYAVHAMNYKKQCPENAFISLLVGFIVYQFIMSYEKPEISPLVMSSEDQKLLNAVLYTEKGSELKSNLKNYFASINNKEPMLETADKRLYNAQQRLEAILFALNYQQQYKDSKFTSLKNHITRLITQIETARKKVQTA